jgi:hypothetical protein
MIIAADHPARGALRAGADPLAMANRFDLLDRLRTALAARRRIAMVEPFISHRVDGRVRNELTAEAMIRACAVAAGLGNTSAYTWLKVPVVPEMERVMAATTLPALILGGEVSDDADRTFARWARALDLPTVHGLVIGRSLLYPASGTVAGAVDRAVGLL